MVHNCRQVKQSKQCSGVKSHKHAQTRFNMIQFPKRMGHREKAWWLDGSLDSVMNAAAETSCSSVGNRRCNDDLGLQNHQRINWKSRPSPRTTGIGHEMRWNQSLYNAFVLCMTTFPILKGKSDHASIRKRRNLSVALCVKLMRS